MPKAPVYNLNHENVGEIDLSDVVFGAEVNEGLLYDVVKAQLASKRSGTHAVKNRALVAGSRKKIYRQKGTGNARHGAKSAPVFVGGGQAHGPKPKEWGYKPPKKMRLGALRSALSLKVKEGTLKIVDAFDLSEIKTKALAATLSRLEVSSSAVIVDVAPNDTLRMSARNLPKHQYLPPEGVNPYDLLRHEHLVLTKRAVEALEARCTR
ncbi:MAG: 50S ribosomal protein L4 [Myxococcota bacterium]